MDKEILDAFKTRIKSPFFGYYALAFIIFNWKPIFVLLFSELKVFEKFDFFSDNTNTKTLFVFPIVLSIVYAISYPWITFLFSYLIRKPIELKRTLDTRIEHNILIKKERLERTRAKYIDVEERKLIEEAKRQEEIQEISSKEIREDLQKRIFKLRNQLEKLKFDSDFEKFIKEKYSLTDSNFTYLKKLVEGKSRNEIANELNISHNAIKARQRSLYNKLNVRSLDEMLRKVREDMARN